MIWIVLWLAIVFTRLGYLIQYRDKPDCRIPQLGVVAVILAVVFTGCAFVIGRKADLVVEVSRDYALVTTLEGETPICLNRTGSERYYHWYRMESSGISGGYTVETNVSIQYGDSFRMKLYQSVYSSWWARNYMWVFGLDNQDGINYAPTFVILKNTTIPFCRI